MENTHLFNRSNQTEPFIDTDLKTIIELPIILFILCCFSYWGYYDYKKKVAESAPQSGTLHIRNTINRAYSNPIFSNTDKLPV